MIGIDKKTFKHLQFHSVTSELESLETGILHFKSPAPSISFLTELCEAEEL